MCHHTHQLRASTEHDCAVAVGDEGGESDGDTESSEGPVETRDAEDRPAPQPGGFA